MKRLLSSLGNRLRVPCTTRNNRSFHTFPSIAENIQQNIHENYDAKPLSDPSIKFDSKWQHVDCLPKSSQRYNCGISFWGSSKLIVAGGISSCHSISARKCLQPEVTRLVHAYDFESGECRPLPSLNIARADCKVEVADRKVFVLGGYDDHQRLVRKVEVLDLRRPTKFRICDDAILPDDDTGTHMTTLYHENTGQIYLNGAHAFDISSERFKKLPEMKQKRRWPTIGMISDREMVIAGGYCDGPLRSVETLDLYTLERGELPDLPFLARQTGIGLSLRSGDFAVLTNYGYMVFDPLDSKWSEEQIKVADGRFGSLLAGERYSVSKGPSESETRVVRVNPRGLGIGEQEFGGIEVIKCKDKASGSRKERETVLDIKLIQNLVLVILLGALLRIFARSSDRSDTNEIPSVDVVYLKAILKTDIPYDHDELIRFKDELIALEEPLVRWLTQLTKQELLHGISPTPEQIEWVKLTHQLYHKLVPTLRRYFANNTQEPFKVFISHTGVDKLSYAGAIFEYLTSEGVKAFLDRHCIPDGASARDTIFWVAVTCEHAWIVCSPEFVQKWYPMRELMIAYARHVHESPEHFTLRMDCLRKHEARQDWMDVIRQNLRSLRIYDEHGCPQEFPAMNPSIEPEFDLARIRRIASSDLAGGRRLVHRVSRLW